MLNALPPADAYDFIANHPYGLVGMFLTGMTVMAMGCSLLKLYEGPNGKPPLSGAAVVLGLSILSMFVVAHVVSGSGSLSRELTDNPFLLTEPSITSRQVTVMGRSVGEPVSRLTGAVHKGANVYAYEGFNWLVGDDGLIDTVALRADTLEPLQIKTRADIEAKLGRADRVEELTTGFIFSKKTVGWSYHYARGIRVVWMENGGMASFQLHR